VNVGEQRPGEFELFVLLAALRLGADDAYAVSIVDDIEANTGRRVRRANVYTAIQRLEDRGWVTTRMGEPRPERGGKARRLVAVTPLGTERTREAAEQHRAMVQGLEGLLEGTS
jgi:DNA-binding PadR family transcriptional regulator